MMRVHLEKNRANAARMSSASTTNHPGLLPTDFPMAIREWLMAFEAIFILSMKNNDFRIVVHATAWSVVRSVHPKMSFCGQPVSKDFVGLRRTLQLFPSINAFSTEVFRVSICFNYDYLSEAASE